MNAGITEEAGRTARTFFEAMKDQPLALALAVMNLVLLGFLFWFGSTVAEQRKTEIKLIYDNQKEVRELMAKCTERRGDLGLGKDVNL